MKLTPEQLKERWKWIEYWQKWEYQNATVLARIDARHWPDSDDFVEAVKLDVIERERFYSLEETIAAAMRREDWWLEPPTPTVGYNGEAYAPHVYGACNEVAGEFEAR